MRSAYFAILVLGTLAGDGHEKATQATKELHSQVSSLAAKHPEASIGFYAYNLSQHSEVLNYHGDQHLAPASSLKLLTSISALSLLSPEYTFRTIYGYNGKVADGKLRGSLLVKGGGDPTLGSGYLEHNTFDIFPQVVAALHSQGIQRIEGGMVLDISSFDQELIPRTWVWEDMGNYYGTPIGALNVFDNTISITFSSSHENGGPTTIKETSPHFPRLLFDNQVLASDIQRDRAYIFGAPLMQYRQIRGTIPKGRSSFTIKGSVPNPNVFFGEYLRQALQSHGISFGNDSIMLEVSELEMQHELFVDETIKMASMLRPLHLHSLNHYAEAILKQIAFAKTGLGSREKGLELVVEFWQKKGIDLSQAQLHDGSGLSRFNALSAKQLSNILQFAHQESYFAQLKESLPVAGESGSLSHMFKSTPLSGKLWAKSGYLEGVRSYTGYCQNAEGDLLAFCIMINNYGCSASAARNTLEKMLLQLW